MQESETPVSRKPIQSSGRGSSSFGLSKKSVTSAMPRIPSGTFTKKIQRQEKYVVMKPPMGGPSTGPSCAGTCRYAMVRTSCERSTLRNRTSRPTGTIMAPPKPCSTRAAVSSTALLLRPQRTEPRVNSPMPARKTVAPAEPVGGPAADRDEDRDAEQVGGDGHAERHRVGIERDRHLRQRRGDHGGVDLLHDDGRRHDHGDDLWLGGW